MKIIKSLAFVFIFLIFSEQISAQSNFLDGYIINAQKDTIRGKIDYKNWERNPSQISFKSEKENNPSTYKSYDITGFYVNNEFYQTEIVKLEVSSQDLPTMTTSKQSIFSSDTLFLRLLIKGQASLYLYKDEKFRQHFFIKKNEMPIEELVFRKYKDGENIVVTQRKYLNQLSFYFSDCSSKIKISEKLAYEQEALKSLFNEYNQCKGNSVDSYKAEKEKTSVEISLLAGVSSTKLDWISDEFNNGIVTANFNKSTNFTTGIGFDLVTARSNRRWSIYNEILLKSYKTSGESSIGTSKYDLRYLKLNTMGRYYLLNKKIRPYLGLGISNGWAIKSENNVNLDFRKYEQGLIGSLGLNIDKFNMEFRYETSNGMSEQQALSSKVNSYFVLIAYRFTKIKF